MVEVTTHAPSKYAAQNAYAKRDRLKHPEKWRAKWRRWRNANPEKWKLSQKKSMMKLKYGITLAERDAMLAAQGGVCKICARDNSGWRGDWHTDHVDLADGTKLVRGILCHPCNTALQKDLSAEIHRRRADYLESFK